mmetsp:Transcript_85172/g.189337  ORF Transcript_85172/g.189337 Transcript_85172/m.189337 type:complete len:271 (+) Transcript_85172:725-1537(+)
MATDSGSGVAGAQQEGGRHRRGSVRALPAEEPNRLARPEDLPQLFLMRTDLFEALAVALVLEFTEPVRADLSGAELPCKILEPPDGILRLEVTGRFRSDVLLWHGLQELGGGRPGDCSRFLGNGDWCCLSLCALCALIVLLFVIVLLCILLSGILLFHLRLMVIGLMIRQLQRAVGWLGYRCQYTATKLYHCDPNRATAIVSFSPLQTAEGHHWRGPWSACDEGGHCATLPDIGLDLRRKCQWPSCARLLQRLDWGAARCSRARGGGRCA